MCLTAFQYKTHPEYPFILLTNRDERYDRPSEPIHFWEDEPSILGGRDKKRNGTWLGITRSGRVAAMTNHPFTDWEPHPEVRSRGHLVWEYLSRTDSPAHYALTLKDTRRRYNGYRLLFGDLNHLYLYSNVTGICRHFPAGLHAVSNTDDDLSTHRTTRARQLVGDYLQSHPELDPDEMIGLFRDTEPAAALSRIPAELSIDTARRHSSVFIKGEEFGTVTTTLLLMDKHGQVTVTEQRYSSQGPSERTQKSFRLENP